MLTKKTQIPAVKRKCSSCDYETICIGDNGSQEVSCPRCKIGNLEVIAGT